MGFYVVGFCDVPLLREKIVYAAYFSLLLPLSIQDILIYESGDCQYVRFEIILTCSCA